MATDRTWQVAGAVQSPTPETVMGLVAIAVALAFLLTVAAGTRLTAEQMHLVRPMIVATAVYVVFGYLLNVRTGAHLFGELGFIYVSLAMAYTLLPGLTFLGFDFYFPVLVDGGNVVDLAPSPAELGVHLWRHVLFIASISAGYILVRGGPIAPDPDEPSLPAGSGRLIAMWMVIIALSMFVAGALSAPVTTYVEHYTRYDHLGWFARRFVYMALILKGGGYSVLLALLFSDFRRYRWFLLVAVPLIGVYEGIYSFGSRIETLTILLSVVVLYHIRVARVSLVKGATYLVLLAVLFSGLEIFRASAYSLQDAQFNVLQESGLQVAEFGAVFNTSFHLYAERDQGTLPYRPWPMYFNEFVAIVPFVDHLTYNPQYWYARNYFPEAAVPPQTMGVLADSALWGGEIDLFIRSLLNGALFALLTRWFLRRRESWIRLNVYVFLCATAVLTLKYSVLYQLVPLVRILIPTLAVTEVLAWLARDRIRLRHD